MQITKQMVRESKDKMARSIAKLCKLEDHSLLLAEFKRVFSAAYDLNPNTPFADMRQLLLLATLDNSFPEHWIR